MDDRDLVYVNEYHRRLIAASMQERILRDARPARPGLRDYVLLHMGGYLISLGQRLRSASIYELEQPAELAQEGA
jgi:hypothetical protein